MVFKKKQDGQINYNFVNKLSNEFNLDNDIIKLLFMRGYKTREQISRFINPSFNDFHDPFLLKNMDKIVERITLAIKNKESIVILGDYDTDGISATAIVYKFLKESGIEANVFLPNRIADGYGLSIDTIDKIATTYKPNLIITVDCGVSAIKEVDYCKSLGIDIIVTDHHDIPDTIPNCLVLNPKMEDQKYPFKELCGAGVAFKLVQAFLGIEVAKEYLTMATLATVADIVPLKDENRAITYFGLKYQEKQLPLGLKRLLKKLKINMPLTSTDISFKLAPKINATGRMGDALVAFNLYIEKDNQKISQYINELLELNDKRLKETNNINEDAYKKLKDINISNLGIIVLYDDNWESGVLGIICSRLVEMYNRPVCVLTKVDNEYKGSLRSIPSINIFDALSNVKDVLIQFGGHNQAAGVTIKPENLKIFTKKINEYILKTYGQEDFLPEKKYDLDISKLLITENFVKQLDVLEPFGLANEKPLFKLTFNNASVSRIPKHFNHIKIKLNNLELIAFNMGNYAYNLNSNCNKEAIVELGLETFGNRTKIKGLLKYLSFHKLNTQVKSDIVNAHYITQLKYIDSTPSAKKNIFIKEENVLYKTIDNLTKNSNFGTLIIANTMESYNNFVKNNSNIDNFELYKINNYTGINTLLFAPHFDNNYTNYSNIVLLDAPIHIDYINYLANTNSPDRKIYICNKKFDMSILKNLETSRAVFVNYHNIIKKSVFKNIVEGDMITYYTTLKKLNPQFTNIKYNQFLFVLMVFEEINIIKVDNGQISFTNKKSELTKSKIYNLINLFLKARE